MHTCKLVSDVTLLPALHVLMMMVILYVNAWRGMMDHCVTHALTATLANLQTFPVLLASAQETVMSAIAQQENVLAASTIPLVPIVNCVLISFLEMPHSKCARVSVYTTDSGVISCCIQ